SAPWPPIECPETPCASRRSGKRPNTRSLSSSKRYSSILQDADQGGRVALSQKPAPTPKSQPSLSPGTASPRGLVSGTTKAKPARDAGPCAPALTVKFSSVQVSPESQNSTGTDPCALAGGRYREKRMGQPRSSD